MTKKIQDYLCDILTYLDGYKSESHLDMSTVINNLCFLF